MDMNQKLWSWLETKDCPTYEEEEILASPTEEMVRGCGHDCCCCDSQCKCKPCS